jgi:acyl-CoA synthetase (AMP-forming)/AMP-acid ligase II
VAHLISETSAQAVICSKRTKQAIRKAAAVDHPISLIEAITHTNLKGLPSSNLPPIQPSDEVGAVILHSSGTTGLPKPIRLTNRYLLGYAACHQLAPDEAEGRINVSTLPLYHVNISHVGSAR